MLPNDGFPIKPPDRQVGQQPQSRRVPNIGRTNVFGGANGTPPASPSRDRAGTARGGRKTMRIVSDSGIGPARDSLPPGVRGHCRAGVRWSSPGRYRVTYEKAVQVPLSSWVHEQFCWASPAPESRKGRRGIAQDEAKGGVLGSMARGQPPSPVGTTENQSPRSSAVPTGLHQSDVRSSSRTPGMNSWAIARRAFGTDAGSYAARSESKLFRPGYRRSSHWDGARSSEAVK